MAWLDEVDRTDAAVVGGKAANLGELARLDGVDVPPGFCVTTHAFRRVVAEVPGFDDRLGELEELNAGDDAAVRELAESIRRSLEDAVVPDDVAAAIAGALARLGDRGPWAVRSSATTEDLPAAASAGQHDSFLNVVGAGAVLQRIRRCWASLFTERAVAYRARNGIGHREVAMAVVVQRMAAADAAGVLFTADPVTSDRRIVAVEACFGLGESLVAGHAPADVYRVRDGEVIGTTIATKHTALVAAPAGGIVPQPVEPARREQPVLTDAQVLRLAQLGRRIEAHLGEPQDVEWCLAGDGIRIVQSRPITTLFPVPAGGGGCRVDVSVGHQQMMTDAMKPLGWSLWQLIAMRPMHEAGGRLFVDVTDDLAAPGRRARLLDLMSRSDPLLGDALRTVVERGGVLAPAADVDQVAAAPGAAPPPIATDPAHRRRAGPAQRRVRRRAGPDDRRDSRVRRCSTSSWPTSSELKRGLADPLSMQVIMAAMEAGWWLDEHLEAWLGEPRMADALSRSAPGNVTSEMGLALLDVADAIRPHPEVVAALARRRRPRR